MLNVPTIAVPNQTMTVTLGGQTCQIDLLQKPSGLYMNLSVNNGIIISGVICENLNRIVRDLYLGFIGDFFFRDVQGTSDPVYTGLNDRYQLYYIEANELPPGVG